MKAYPIHVLIAVLSCTWNVHGSFWMDSWNDFKVHSLPIVSSESPEETTQNPTTIVQSVPPSDDSSLEIKMRKMIQEELKKYGAGAHLSSNSPQTAAPTTSTENPADLIRRIISEELSKYITPAPSTTTSAPVPIWKSWSDTKYWAKQPGPNGEAPPGFIGSLQSKYGGYSGVVHPSGSPGWVWSQIAPKWAAKAEPTIVPPSQIVDGGAWQMVLPPQNAAPPAA